MCGRYTQTCKPDEIKQLLDFDGDDRLLRPRYNLAPSQEAPVIIAGQHLKSMRWGLVPFWAKDEKIGHRMINARTETIAEKPAFKKLLTHRRCLVLADGFYEWQKSGRSKQPFYFRLRTKAPFAFAGLWDRWHGSEGRELATFTILTTSANEVLRPVHDRMPVMLSPEGCRTWLDLEGANADVLPPLWGPFPAAQMTGYPVSSRVNSPKDDQPGFVEPLASSETTAELDLGILEEL